MRVTIVRTHRGLSAWYAETAPKVGDRCYVHDIGREIQSLSTGLEEKLVKKTSYLEEILEVIYTYEDKDWRDKVAVPFE